MKNKLYGHQNNVRKICKANNIPDEVKVLLLSEVSKAYNSGMEIYEEAHKDGIKAVIETLKASQKGLIYEKGGKKYMTLSIEELENLKK
jgi:predicted nuclease with RNAse H fold